MLVLSNDKLKSTNWIVLPGDAVCAIVSCIALKFPVICFNRATLRRVNAQLCIRQSFCSEISSFKVEPCALSRRMI